MGTALTTTTTTRTTTSHPQETIRRVRRRHARPSSWKGLTRKVYRLDPYVRSNPRKYIPAEFHDRLYAEDMAGKSCGMEVFVAQAAAADSLEVRIGLDGSTVFLSVLRVDDSGRVLLSIQTDKRSLVFHDGTMASYAK